LDLHALHAEILAMNLRLAVPTHTPSHLEFGAFARHFVSLVHRRFSERSTQATGMAVNKRIANSK